MSTEFSGFKHPPADFVVVSVEPRAKRRLKVFLQGEISVGSQCELDLRLADGTTIESEKFVL